MPSPGEGKQRAVAGTMAPACRAPAERSVRNANSLLGPLKCCIGAVPIDFIYFEQFHNHSEAP